VNDDAALGRTTKYIPDQEHEGPVLNLDRIPCPIQSLVDENFRAVKIVAGDSLSAALSDRGDLRVWGSLRVGDEGQELGFWI
jgi:regulator of chromosome condensation